MSLLLAAAVLSLTMLLAPHVQAANVIISTKASKSTVKRGENFTVDVLLSSGSAEVVGALFDVSYEPSKIQYVSASYNSWTYLDTPSGADYKRVNVYTTSPRAGNLTLARVTFKALASSGSTNFRIENASVGSTDNENPDHTVSVSGTSVNFASATTSQPGGNSGSSGNNSNDSEEEPADPGRPTEEEERANGEVDDDAPVPIDAVQDNATYPVEIKVTDETDQPRAGVEVTLGDQKATTDDGGIARFMGIPSGEHEVKAAGTTQTITVETGDPAMTQSFAMTAKEKSLPSWLLYGLATLAVLVVLALIALILRRKRGGKPPVIAMPSAATPIEEKKPEEAINRIANPSMPKPDDVFAPTEKPQDTNRLP